jgi:hypothetical protein
MRPASPVGMTSAPYFACKRKVQCNANNIL